MWQHTMTSLLKEAKLAHKDQLFLGVFVFIFSPLPPALLRCKWHISFGKFKVYNVVIIYTYILQNDYNNVS